jgi:hypothetical protein
LNTLLNRGEYTTPLRNVKRKMKVSERFFHFLFSPS